MSSVSFWTHSLFLASVGLFWLLSQIYRPEIFETTAIIFVAIFLEALPFVMLGAILGGLIEVFMDRERMLKWLPRKRFLTPFVAGLLGIVVPVCECGVIVVVRRLLKKGLPPGAAIAYLLAGPILNVVVGTSTAVAYSMSWKVVALRMVFGYAVAVLVALVMEALMGKKGFLLPSVQTIESHSEEGPSAFGKKVWLSLRYGSQDFLDISRFLVIGAFFASLFQALISKETFLSSALGSPAFSIGIMMLLAFLLNLCSEADAFVAASFQSLGMSLSAQMAFMIMGPMMDVKLLSMYFGVFRKRVVFWMTLLISLFIFLGMLLLEVL